MQKDKILGQKNKILGQMNLVLWEPLRRRKTQHSAVCDSDFSIQEVMKLHMYICVAKEKIVLDKILELSCTTLAAIMHIHVMKKNKI